MTGDNKFNLDIGGMTVPCTFTESRKSRYIRLVVNSDGLKVIRPVRAGIGDVEKIIREKSDWILKHYIDLHSKKAERTERNWTSGEKVLYKGESYYVNVFSNRHKLASVGFDGKGFDVFVYEDLPAQDRKKLIETAFKKWFVKVAHEYIKERLDYHCRVLGLRYSRIKIREQKTRWGSCSKKGNLNFNWKLIMAPPWVIDYVVIHEICHLRYLNHSKAYWGMVESIMPEYKRARDWLKKNGARLVL